MKSQYALGSQCLNRIDFSHSNDGHRVDHLGMLYKRRTPFFEGGQSE